MDRFIAESDANTTNGVPKVILSEKSDILSVRKKDSIRFE